MLLVIRRVFLLAVALVSTSSLYANAASLVRSGEARAVILVAAQEEADHDPSLRSTLHTSVQQAGAEFADVVNRMTGATLLLRKITPDALPSVLKELEAENLTAVVLGSLALQVIGPLSESAQEAWSDPSSFVIRATSASVAIAGPTPRATEIGVYALLEQFGVRWFFPGELGTVIPSVKDIEVALQDTLERPSFEARNFQLQDTSRWINHQRAGGAYFPGAHGIPLGRDISFKTHPQYYALVDGERRAPQLCLSNPEVLQRAIVEAKAFFSRNPAMPWYGMGPEDGGGFCQCDGCLAMDGGDYDFFSNSVSMTDRYIRFFNAVLKGIEGDYPDRKIAFYIYHAYMRPPVKVTPSPRITGAIAPIALCRLHGANNPVCPERGYLKEIIAAWSKILPELHERGYWFNLADPAMPFVQISRLRDELPYYASQGVKGFRTECNAHWVLHGPSLYLAGRLLWDVKADVDALLHEYTTLLFGPASEPMKAYFTELDQAVSTGDHHAGSSFTILEFFPREKREKLQELLKEASQLAGASPYRERVALFGKGFTYSDAFARMLEARNEQDWEGAREALDQVDRLMGELTGMEPPMLGAGSAVSHLRRFFRLPVEQGYRRTTGGNQLIAPLGDEWEFLTDPSQLGQALGYEKEGLTGGNWQKVPTYSTTWSDLGLRYYKGLAWYRQAVTLPEGGAGKRLFLWFGGLDETARIWVNGKLVGTSPRSAFTPFEVDATGALKAGENQITLCVANLKTDELGTGGITAPAFIYAPAKGEQAELENTRPLRDTFP